MRRSPGAGTIRSLAPQRGLSALGIRKAEVTHAPSVGLGWAGRDWLCRLHFRACFGSDPPVSAEAMQCRSSRRTCGRVPLLGLQMAQIVHSARPAGKNHRQLRVLLRKLHRLDHAISGVVQKDATSPNRDLPVTAPPRTMMPAAASDFLGRPRFYAIFEGTSRTLAKGKKPARRIKSRRERG